MAADKLSLYNDALRICSERKLANFTENREARRVLDDVYVNEVDYCLEQGFWKHAKRVVEMPASSSTVPQFGFNCAVGLPNDWIRTYQVSSAPQLTPPLLDYREEMGFIFSNTDPLYLAYISKDPQYGWNLGKWGRSFADYVAHRLALRAAPMIVKDTDLRNLIIKEEKKARVRAKANDAMNDPPGFSPRGTWVRARSNNAGDRGPGSPSGGNVNMGPG